MTTTTHSTPQERFRRKALVMALAALGLTGPAWSAPVDPAVRAGSARVEAAPGLTTVTQSSDRAVIDWRSFSVGAAERVVFQQPSASSAILNRVTGPQLSSILGRIDANGSVALVNPNGIVFGPSAQINVGSFIAATANIRNEDFMAARMSFDQPGSSEASIVNAGAISVADGGLAALVAPHVRNDGIISARLGSVVLAAGQVFTLDLHGDRLISLGIADDQAAALVSQSGRIEADGGMVVLATPEAARSALDRVVNMSGSIQADTIAQSPGRILLLAPGAEVSVSGSLAARGSAPGSSGGSMAIAGDRVLLASTAVLDASGEAGGGSIHVGGAWQGSGVLPRASSSSVADGAHIDASATRAGNGGEVVVWADGQTAFAGSILARGGALSGNGGRVEVSGKASLDFAGFVNAAAPAGFNGSLLLDPYDLVIGQTEAGLIARVLRTGTSTSLQADHDITLAAMIDGRGGASGGGISLTAGNLITLVDHLVTHNGAVTFNAGNTVSVASGKAVFAGSAPISVTSGASLVNAPFVTSGALFLQSTAGSIQIDTPIDAGIGPVSLQAAQNIVVNQPVANRSGLSLIAGQDVQINALVDARAASGGTLAITAGGSIALNQSMVTQAGNITLSANGGTLTQGASYGLYAPGASITLTSNGHMTVAGLQAASIALASGGTLRFDGPIDSSTGALSATSGLDIELPLPLLGLQSGGTLQLGAGRDLIASSSIDGRGASGSMQLSAGRDVLLGGHVLTRNAHIALSAGGTLTQLAGSPAPGAGSDASTQGASISISATGNLSQAAGYGVFASNGNVTLSAGGGLTAVSLQGNQVALTSTAGNVTLDGVLDADVGQVTIAAGLDAVINQPLSSLRSGQPLQITAGQDILLNAQIDGLGGVAGGSVSLNATRHVLLNQNIATHAGNLLISAGGNVSQAASFGLFATNANIGITAGGSLSVRALEADWAVLTTTTGAVSFNSALDADLKRLSVTSGAGITVSQPILSPASGQPLAFSAVGNITLDAAIDGRGGSAGGSVSLASSAGSIAVNQDIATNNGAISLSAANTVTQAAGKQLNAGNANISVSTGAAFSSGVYVTSGALTLSASGGSITIANPIDDQTGNTTISAAGANSDVIINARIANVDRASTPTLSVSAGRDIIVNAQVGPALSGADAAAIDAFYASLPSTGRITLSASRDLQIHQDVVTKNAPLSLSASTGTLSLAAGKQLRSGAGSLSITTGGNLTNDIDFVTTGTLNLTSTAGTLTIAESIPESVGTVNLSGYNGVVVNGSPDAASAISINSTLGITVTSAAGGLTMGSYSYFDSHDANIAITTYGHIAISTLGIRANREVTITSTEGKILSGSVGFSRFGATYVDPPGIWISATVPDRIVLNARYGIVNLAGDGGGFDTNSTPDVEATSTDGPIRLSVHNPARLRITASSPTAGDIFTGGSVGPDAVLNAGRDAILSPLSLGSNLTATAGRDISITGGSTLTTSLHLTAGRDITLESASGVDTRDVIWVEGAGGLYLNAGRTIDVDRLHVSNALFTPGTDEAAPQPTTLIAGDAISLARLQTIGDVTLTVNDPGASIWVGTDLGAHVSVETPVANLWNPGNLGIASLTINATGGPNGSSIWPSIQIEGARAVNFVTINAPGATLTSTHQIYCTAPACSSTINVGSQTIGVADVATVTRLLEPGPIAPTAPPGNPVAGPGAPGIPGATPPAAPGAASASNSLPGASGASLTAPDSADASNSLSAPAGLLLAGLALPAGGSEGELLDNSSRSITDASTGAFEEIVPTGDDPASSEPDLNGMALPPDLLAWFDEASSRAQGADLGRGNGFFPPGDVFEPQRRKRR